MFPAPVVFALWLRDGTGADGSASSPSGPHLHVLQDLCPVPSLPQDGATAASHYHSLPPLLLRDSVPPPPATPASLVRSSVSCMTLFSSLLGLWPDRDLHLPLAATELLASKEGRQLTGIPCLVLRGSRADADSCCAAGCPHPAAFHPGALGTGRAAELSLCWDTSVTVTPWQCPHVLCSLCSRTHSSRTPMVSVPSCKVPPTQAELSECRGKQGQIITVCQCPSSSADGHLRKVAASRSRVSIRPVLRSPTPRKEEGGGLAEVSCRNHQHRGTSGTSRTPRHDRGGHKGWGGGHTSQMSPFCSHTKPVPSCASLHFLPGREGDAFPRLGIPFLTSSCLKAAPHGSGRGIFSTCPAFTSWMRHERGSDIKRRAALALKGILSFLLLSHRKTSVKRGW